MDLTGRLTPTSTVTVGDGYSKDSDYLTPEQGKDTSRKPLTPFSDRSPLFVDYLRPYTIFTVSGNVSNVIDQWTQSTCSRRKNETLSFQCHSTVYGFLAFCVELLRNANSEFPIPFRYRQPLMSLSVKDHSSLIFVTTVFRERSGTETPLLPTLLWNVQSSTTTRDIYLGPVV